MPAGAVEISQGNGGRVVKLQAIIIMLDKAVCPEDIFGVLNGEPLAIKFRKLAKQVHPDLFPSAEKEKAEEAFKSLQSWYEKAESKVAAGTYGDRASTEVSIQTKTDLYQVTKRLAKGDICEVYLASNKAKKDVVLKVTRTPVNNDLTANEAKTLTHMRADDSPAKDLKIMAHIPQLLDSFELRDAKVKKRVNVLNYTPKCYTLAQVREAYPHGLQLADAAWMFNRMLGALLAAHQSHVVHGAVVPDHFIVFPEDHNGVLLDWNYAVAPGGTIKAITPAWRSFYPPEVLAKKPVQPGTDLYMAANCLMFLLGGNVQSHEFPSSLAYPVRGLLRSCWLSQPHRPQSAFDLHKDFGELLKAIYGRPKFRPFVMPEPASSVK